MKMGGMEIACKTPRGDTRDRWLARAEREGESRARKGYSERALSSGTKTDAERKVAHTISYGPHESCHNLDRAVFT